MHFGGAETQRDPWHAMGSMEERRDMIMGLFRDMHEYQFPVWKEKTITQKSELHILHKVGLGAE